MNDEEEKNNDSNSETDDEHIPTGEVLGGSSKSEEEVKVFTDTFTEENKTVCQVCGMSFSSYGAYQSHFKNSHK